MLKKFFLACRQSPGQKNKQFGIYTAKVFIVFILILAVFLLLKPVLAQTIEPGLNTIAPYIGLTTTDIRVTIARIIQVALGFLGILAVALILYGGFIWMTSAGEPEKIDKAKKILRDAVIGLIIILLAFAIASFVLNALLLATLGPPGPPPGYGSEGGALGNGIIESHYPPRNAIGIPRNTSIVVTFKLPIAVNTIINNTNGSVDASGKPIFGDCIDKNGNGAFEIIDANNSECDLINTDSIKIHKTGEVIYVTNVRASYTTDFKTFVFKPFDLLGSPDQPINYTVELTNNIRKFDGSDAFGAFGGYDWKFEVSTLTDLTPPQIVSVIPKPVNDSDITVPRNMVIQINFNEAINPITLRGKAEVEGGVTVGKLITDTFNNMNVYVAPNTNLDKFIAGEFMYGNEYRTVEFVTNDLCGTNACGGDVFCLPLAAEPESPNPVGVLIKAATLDILGRPSAVFPYTGLVDMADNSLDGNLDGQAQGPQAQSAKPAYYLNENIVKNKYVTNPDQGDDAKWTFYTNDKIDLVPPQIDLDPTNKYYPEANSKDINPVASYTIPFDKLMMATSIKPDRGYGDGYCKCTIDADCGCPTNPLSPQCDPLNKCDLVHGTCLNKDQSQFVCTESIPKVLCPTSQVCQEKHHITLIQPTAPKYIPRGFWCGSANNGAETKTTAFLKHAVLAEYLTYGIDVGSGVKDLMQNCYQPCSGPGCIREPGGKPNEFIQGTPWQGVYPSCDLTTPTP